MVQETFSPFGSIRIRDTTEELKKIQSWAEEVGLCFSTRDLYDRWSTERIWSFDFGNKEDFLMFYIKWEDRICGHRIES